jgi:hypothetical protein
MKQLVLVAGIIGLLLFSGALVSAATGVGISPTKSAIRVESGSEQIVQLVVFNSGDNPLTIAVEAKGDVARFVTFDQTSALIEPEPKPQQLPIKNGKTFFVTVKIPAGTRQGLYSGELIASGSASGSSQFGGTVGVASYLDVYVVPPQSLLDRIPRSYLIAGLAILCLVGVFFVLKKAGVRIQVKRTQ